MNKLVFLIFFSLFFKLFGQTVSFQSKLKIEYKATLQLGENFRKDYNFVLLTNANSYYFASNQNYLNDTKRYIVNDNTIDTKKNSSLFRERVLKNEEGTTVFVKVVDSKFRYKENVTLKWVLYGDTKTINGVKCQMATTNKYGRRWIAYFSSDYDFSAGPYKFSGLPGLIFELYDTRDDYHFTLVKLEKAEENFEVNLSNFKLYTKEKYLKAKDNLEFSIGAYPAMEAEQSKYFLSILERKRKMFNNPIELKPFE